MRGKNYTTYFMFLALIFGLLSACVAQYWSW